MHSLASNPNMCIYIRLTFEVQTQGSVLNSPEPLEALFQKKNHEVPKYSSFGSIQRKILSPKSLIGQMFET